MQQWGSKDAEAYSGTSQVSLYATVLFNFKQLKYICKDHENGISKSQVRKVTILCSVTFIENILYFCLLFSQMVGVEYILLHAQEPILYIIRKQQRQSPAQGEQCGMNKGAALVLRFNFPKTFLFLLPSDSSQWLLHHSRCGVSGPRSGNCHQLQSGEYLSCNYWGMQWNCSLWRMLPSLFCVFSFLLSMESSLLSTRPCHIVVITHPKGTGGILRTRRREVRLWSLSSGIIRTTRANEVNMINLYRKKQAQNQEEGGAKFTVPEASCWYAPFRPQVQVSSNILPGSIFFSCPIMTHFVFMWPDVCKTLSLPFQPKPGEKPIPGTSMK